MSEYDRLKGRNIHQHPFSHVAPRRYRKVANVLATEAPADGEVDTPEGVMRFAAGDFILTDDPPTHAWPVAREVFLRTYRSVGGLHVELARFTEKPVCQPCGGEDFKFEFSRFGVEEGLRTMADPEIPNIRVTCKRCGWSFRMSPRTDTPDSH